MEKEKGNWLTRAIAEGGVKAITFFIVKTFVIPAGLPIITIAIGYMTGVPWFYVWLGFLASLALVFHWLLKMNEWLYKTRVENKVVVSGVDFGTDIKTGGVFIQLQLKNTAEYPIDIRVSDFQVQLGDRVPINENKELNIISIPAYGIGWKNSGSITVEEQLRPYNVDGHIKYEVQYGRSKNFLYKVQGKKHVTFRFSESDAINMCWHDAV